MEDVEPEDEGTYVCEAENEAGVAQAVAKLTVQTEPHFLISPTGR